MIVSVYPRFNEVTGLSVPWPDANGVNITSAGARVQRSTWIINSVNAGHLRYDDPLGIYLPEDRTGGTSGSTDVALQTQAQLGVATFTSATNAVDILGCTEAGDGGGARFKRITSDFPPAGIGVTNVGILTAADGSQWCYVPDGRGVNAKAFGASPDASASANVAAIQNAIIFDVYYARVGKVYIPAGTYNLNDTIHLGYGVSGFTAGSLEGDGRYGESFPETFGTLLVWTTSDRPGIAVQGMRSPKIAKMMLRGPNLAYIAAANFCASSPTTGSVDDTVLANWIGPSMNAKFNGRYTPCAAIAIDPYSGTRPGTSYPDVTYPTGFGSTQYGKNFSSAPAIEDVYADGWCVPVAVQPCDADGNGDFVYLRDCMFLRNVYGVVSVGNTQSRTLNGDNINCAVFHTGIANAVHGRQSGKIGSEWRNCNFGACIQWFDIGSAGAAGPVKFTGCYGELVWRIGTWGTASSTNCPLELEGCEIGLDGQTTTRGVPVSCLDAPSGPVRLKNSLFNNYASLLTIKSPQNLVEWENCLLSTTATRANDYEKAASTFLVEGLVMTPGVPRPSKFSVKAVHRYNAAGTLLGAEVATDGYLLSRNIALPAWVNKVGHFDTPGARTSEAPGVWYSIDRSSMAAVSLSGRTLSLTLPGYLQPEIQGMAPGDVIIDPDSGLVFWIRARTGTSVTAVLQNGYRSTSLLGATFSTTSGTLYFGNSRIYLPSYYLNATFSTGSTTVSAVARGDGYGGMLTSTISNGDHVFVWPDQYLIEFSTSDAATLLSSVTNGSPGSFVLGSAPAKSETRPLGFMVRSPPANV